MTYIKIFISKVFPCNQLVLIEKSCYEIDIAFFYYQTVERIVIDNFSQFMDFHSGAVCILD